MFKARFINLALALLAGIIGLCGSAAAQQETEWYQVEVIVFRHWTGADSERFPTSPPAPAFDTLTVLRSDGNRPFRRLQSDELQLQGAGDRLESSPDYQVLEHFGWQQPALSEQEAVSIALPLGWQPNVLSFDARMHELGMPVINAPEDSPADGTDEPAATGADSGPPRRQPGIFGTLPRQTRLYGTLTLFRGRYLHIDADLRYRLRHYQPSWTERETVNGTPIYVLKQRRRMRSDELHYLDHPAIGMLVKVTPVEMPAESTAEGASGDQ